MEDSNPPASSPQRGRKRAVARAMAQTLADVIRAELLVGQRAVYADMHSALGTTARLRVSGRLIREDAANVDRDDDTPSQLLTQAELKRAPVTLTLRRGDAAWALGEAVTDDEGYLERALDVSGLGLEPGAYVVEVGVEGVEDEAGEAAAVVVGQCDARLLALDHAEAVVRSDVDLTYLLTDFQSSSGLAGLLVSSADRREALPGMEEVFKALRAGREGDAARPMVFLSGSPRFFKRTLEAKLRRDGVAHDGLVLKPFKDIVAGNLRRLAPREAVDELREQVGYKLHALLKLRLDLPPVTPEILMGDDSEADVVVYALYQRLVRGALDAASLAAQLDALGVAQVWRAQVEALAAQVQAQVGARALVQAIYINRTGCAGPHAAGVEDHLEGGLVRYHSGAWPLVLDLFEHGWVGQSGVEAVRARLLALGVDAEGLGAAAQAGVDDGFLSPWTVTLFDPTRPASG